MQSVASLAIKVANKKDIQFNLKLTRSSNANLYVPRPLDRNGYAMVGLGTGSVPVSVSVSDCGSASDRVLS